MALYYGITIGPVLSTLSLTSKPAGLWGGSYLFSYLARELCQALVDDGIGTENIISPYFEMDSNNHIKKEISGVGLFHDRIIFQADHKNMTDICRIVNCVKSKVSKQLAEAIGDLSIQNFMEKYFRINIVCQEVVGDINPIQKLSPFLDACELMPIFNQDVMSNPVIDLLDKDNDSTLSSADLLKKSFLVEDCDGQWPLYEKNSTSIKSMKSIADAFRKESDLKLFRYCAIVQADGDGISKILSKLYKNEDIKKFSKCCFSFAVKATNTLKNYGALNIYAGGDDLLFIAPLIGANGHLFHLIEALKKDFRNAFIKIMPKDIILPTISFGISINYYKYPLYEGFEAASNALFNKSKSMKGKDTIFIEVTKHSGLQFCIGFLQTNTNQLYDAIVKFWDHAWKYLGPEPAEIILNSVSQKIRMFDTLFYKAFMESDNAIISFIDNTFDSEYHEHVDVGRFLEHIQSILCLLRRYYLDLSNEDKMKIQELLSIKNDITDKDSEEITFLLNYIDSILRLLKFFVERGDE